MLAGTTAAATAVVVGMQLLIPQQVNAALVQFPCAELNNRYILVRVSFY